MELQKRVSLWSVACQQNHCWNINNTAYSKECARIFYAKVLWLRVRVVHDQLSPMRQPVSLIRSVIGESFLITPSTRHMHRFCSELVDMRQQQVTGKD